MLAGMKGLERTGLEFKCNQKRLSNREKKFRGLLAICPQFFLAIAPALSAITECATKWTEPPRRRS